MIYKTSKSFIKNFVSESWDTEYLEVMLDEASIKAHLDSTAEELWQNCYHEIDYSNWTAKDFAKIVEAVKTRLVYLADEE